MRRWPLWLAVLGMLLATVPVYHVLVGSGEFSATELWSRRSAWFYVILCVIVALETLFIPLAVPVYQALPRLVVWLWLPFGPFMGCLWALLAWRADHDVRDVTAKLVAGGVGGLAFAILIFALPPLVYVQIPYGWHVLRAFQLTLASVTGNASALDGAITHWRRLAIDPRFTNSVKLFTDGSKVAGGVLTMMLAARFRRTSSGVSAYEAEAAGRVFLPSLASFVTAFPQPRRWRITSNAVFLAVLAEMLILSACRSGRVDLLDEAIDLFRRSASMRHRSATSLNMLGCALRTRYFYTKDLRSLNEAIDLLDEAVTATRILRAEYQTDLGLALLGRWEHTTASVEDLDAARRALLEATKATNGDDPDYAARQTLLAIALHETALVTDDPEMSRRAAYLARQAANRDNAPIRDRLLAAQNWGAYAAACGDWNSAVTGYRTAMTLLPLLVWHGLSSSDRQWLLSDWTDLAGNAAAAAITTGDIPLAVEFLEHGRSVLWNQLLQTRSTPHQAGVPPGLLSRLQDIGAELSSLGDGGETIEWWHAAERRQTLAREWDTLVARIRQLPGQELFLLPRPYKDLGTDTNSPTVLINIGEHRCDALVVSNNPPRAIPLPDLSISDLESNVNRVYSAYRRSRQPGTNWVDRASFQRSLATTLGWLWDVVAEPVLDALGYTTPPDLGQSWPRVWWCPTGPLTLLPLHAAGHHTDRHDTVLDRVISSYTTTLDVLQRAQRPVSLPKESRLLLVAVADAPGLPYLPAVITEANTIGLRLSNRCDLLDGPQATRSVVLSALRSYPCVHFACHGALAPDPTLSSLHMHDKPLTVADISALHLPDAALAYLSACETAIPDQRLADEMIHPAAALQAAGYHHVLATVWNIHSEYAAHVADDVYAQLATPTNGLILDHTAEALHKAVRRLRDKYPHSPGDWAAYVHYGP